MKSLPPQGERLLYICNVHIYTQPFSRYLRKTTRFRLTRIYRLLYIISFFLFVTVAKVIAIIIKNKDFPNFFNKKRNILWQTVVSNSHNSHFREA